MPGICALHASLAPRSWISHRSMDTSDTHTLALHLHPGFVLHVGQLAPSCGADSFTLLSGSGWQCRARSGTRQPTRSSSAPAQQPILHARCAPHMTVWLHVHWIPWQDAVHSSRPAQPSCPPLCWHRLMILLAPWRVHNPAACRTGRGQRNDQPAVTDQPHGQRHPVRRQLPARHTRPQRLRARAASALRNQPAGGFHLHSRGSDETTVTWLQKSSSWRAVTCAPASGTHCQDSMIAMTHFNRLRKTVRRLKQLDA